MCSCYECLRREGITDPNRRDSLGRFRCPDDGRYEAKVVPTENGSFVVKGDRVD